MAKKKATKKKATAKRKPSAAFMKPMKISDKLAEVIGGKSVVNMFEMTKLVSKHLS